MMRGLVLGVLSVAAALFWFLLWKNGTGGDVPTSTGDDAATKSVLHDAASTNRFDAANEGRIAGVVIGDDAAPIAGARVTLATKRVQADRVTVTTDAAGALDFGVRAADWYTIAATSTGLTPAIAVIDSHDATPAPDAIRLVLHPCNAALHGVIRDSADGAIVGA